MDEKDQVNPQASDPNAGGGGSEGANPENESVAAPVDEGAVSAKAEGGASRMSAAKAFYRAMYAGEEVNPDDYGIQLSTQQEVSQPRECAACKSLAQELQEAQTKTAEVDSLYKRMAADFENYRKRTDREREEYTANGMIRAIDNILPALDDLDRAQQSLANVTDPKVFLDSFNVVYKRFASCLEQLGAKPMTVIGEPFDPRLHEPVQEIPTNDYPDGTVVHELRRGYMFKERVLRPALVNVSARTEDAPAAETPAAPAAEAAPAETAPAEAAAPAPVEPQAQPQPESSSTEQALQGLVQKPDKQRPTAQELTKDLHKKPTSTQDLPVIDVDERLLEGEIAAENPPQPPAEEPVYDIDSEQTPVESGKTDD